MLLTILVIALWFIGFLVSNTFGLILFAQKTLVFLWSFLGLSIVLVLCAAILNISLNIGLIAESKWAELTRPEETRLGKKTGVWLLIGLTAFIAFLFAGDYFSRYAEKKRFMESAEYILETYAPSVNNISVGISDTSLAPFIPDALRFLSSQKAEFPRVFAIASKEVKSQRTFIEYNESSRHYIANQTDQYYKCTNDDCEYLQSVLYGENMEPLYLNKGTEYRLYYPIRKDGVCFILVFTERNSYGSFGS
jgi:hypothetical protein